MMNVNTMLAGLKELVNNPTPRIAVGLCLDVSSSMKGAPIRELNKGVQEYLAQMRGDDMTRYSVETAVVTFATEVNRLSDFRLPDDVQLPEMTAEGTTHMGDGLMEILDQLDKRKSQYKATGVDYYQPMLVVMSDGHPNGNRETLEKAIGRISQLTQHRKLTVVAVGIGPDADLNTLARVSPMAPPVRLDGIKFHEFFVWLSQSVAEIAMSQPDEETGPDRNALAALAAEVWPAKGL